MASVTAGLRISAASPPHFNLDEDWKLPKKEGSCRSRSSPATARQRRYTFTRKCARLVKEQRARFYVMRRCVAILVCWRDYSDH